MRIRVIDAFTEVPFRGNPAGVCLLPDGDWPDDDWMRAVAAELNLSETAFARPSGSGSTGWDLRWFTPTVEVDLCGHATLATAHALDSDGRSGGSVRFATRSGILSARTGEAGAITLDFPLGEALPIPPERMHELAGLSDALGAEPAELHRTELTGDLLAVYDEEATIRALAPDQAGLTSISAMADVRAFICTAQADNRSDADFVSRCFAPAIGIPEDPVTGSAHTVLAAYWSNRLGSTRLKGLQCSARGGVVGTQVVGDRVLLTGYAVTVLDGEITADMSPY